MLTLRCAPEHMTALRRIADLAMAEGGRALVVGGAVRDALLERDVVDLDVEVSGIAPDRVEAMLAESFAVDLVGKAFGIVKLKDVPIDVSVPRRESKRGVGHRGFAISAEPDLTIAEAAARRDFTFNALAFDPLTGEVFDPFGGADDLRAGILRHTSPAYADDPLRVLRGMQFAARFDLIAHPSTLALSRTMRMDELPRERLWPEWTKLLLAGDKPSRGLQFLHDSAWLRYFPELDALVNNPQDPEWHPEGDTFTHTGHCLDAFARERTGDEREDLIIGFAVLAHDFGKATTTAMLDGRWRAHGHASAGVAPAERFMARITNNPDWIAAMRPLIVAHLEPGEYYRQQVSDTVIRRLATRVGSIARLVRVCRADHAGRPPLPFETYPPADWLLERAAALAVLDAKPKALVMGRDLIALGAKPGRAFADVLAACYEAQLDGTFLSRDDALAGAATLIEAAGLTTPATPRVSAAPVAPVAPVADVTVAASESVVMQHHEHHASPLSM
jgi:tRNA nucleotidyltransferase (CCA-adding enzyme)